MAAIEPAGEKIARRLQDAVKRLHEDIAQVELWTGALRCFAEPVPEYDPTNSSLNKYILPAGPGAKRPSNARESSRETPRRGGRQPS
jgi:hypothetical protein